MHTLRTTMKWSGGMKFTGVGSFGKTISTDGAKPNGGTEDGFKPTELILFGIAGCTGIDVVSILKKQRQEITELEIEVVAHQEEDYPKPFHTFEVIYRASGNNLDPDKLAKAIELSESKYCVVSQTVQKEAKVNTRYEIV